jgi:hypothetical protein
MVYCTVISLPFFVVLLLCLVLYPTIPYSQEGKKKGVKRKVRVKGMEFLQPMLRLVFRYECFLKDNPAEECHSDVTFDVGMTYMCVLLPGQDVIKKCGDRSPPAE